MKVSVILPTYNRLFSLKKALESLFCQTHPGTQIVVVNDGSTDGTHEYLEGLARHGTILYLHHPNRGLAATRKAGLQLAAGEIVAFTDDDCIAPPDWIARINQEFECTGADAIGGSTVTTDPSNIYALTLDLINNYFKETLNNRPGYHTPFLTGNNVAYRRAILEKAGGPDPRFRMGAEDRDLLFRVSQAGGKVRYVPSIVVQHYHRANFSHFLHHQYTLGRGSYYFYHLHRANPPGRIPLPAYIGLVLRPFRLYPFPKACFMAGLIKLSQAAILCGVLREWITPQSKRPAV